MKVPSQMTFVEISENTWTNVYTALAAYHYFFGELSILLLFSGLFVYLIVNNLFWGATPVVFFQPFFLAFVVLSPFQNYLFTFIPFYFRMLMLFLILKLFFGYKLAYVDLDENKS